MLIQKLLNTKMRNTAKVFSLVLLLMIYWKNSQMYLVKLLDKTKTVITTSIIFVESIARTDTQK